jgi:hypothetical protein
MRKESSVGSACANPSDAKAAVAKTNPIVKRSMGL